MLVAASAGKPITSPTAKMCGTAVRYCSSTWIRPRLSAASPAFSRSSSSVTPCRPAEYITMSAAIRLPLARLVTVPRGVISTLATSSPKRKVTAWSRRWNFSDSTTSGSQKSSIAGRFSTTVTRVPSAANIEAYSMPITPAPTTTSEPGTRCSLQHGVGVEHVLVVELDLGRAGRLGAGGDHDVLGGDRVVVAAGLARAR